MTNSRNYGRNSFHVRIIYKYQLRDDKDEIEYLAMEYGNCHKSFNDTFIYIYVKWTWKHVASTLFLIHMFIAPRTTGWRLNVISVADLSSPDNDDDKKSINHFHCDCRNVFIWKAGGRVLWLLRKGMKELTQQFSFNKFLWIFYVASTHEAQGVWAP